MIVSDLLAVMNALDNEIDVTQGGNDEARAITALSMAQRQCYRVASGISDCLSTIPVNTIKTTPQQEYTPKPAELLRTDALWALSQDGNKRPVWKLRRIADIGGHMPTLPWPLTWTVSQTTGQPFAYYDSTDYWFWQSVPDLVYEMRAYGLWMPDAFADRDSPIELPGRAAVMLQDALAAYALRYLTIAVDDPDDALKGLALEFFAPALKNLARGDRSKGQSKQYEYTHST